MKNITGVEKKSRVRDANESKLNELERPNPRSFNLTRQQSLDQEKRNLEQTLEDKRKELEKINQYAHALKDLGSKKSKNENIYVELLNYRKKAEKEQQGVEELNEEIEKLLLGLRNKSSNDQFKQLVDQSKKIKAKDQDKGKYDQSGLNKLLRDHKIRLKKEISFFKTNKMIYKVLEDNREKDLKNRPILQNKIINDTEQLMQVLGIKIKIDWDAYFDQETPIEIRSTDDCAKIISELHSECDQDEQRRISRQEYNKALEQYNKTRFVTDYLHYDLLSRSYEQVKENLSLAIEPKPERERRQEIDFQESRFDADTCTRLMELIAKANQLIDYRKERKAIELEASKKVEKLQEQKDPHTQIVSKFHKNAMNAVNAIRSGTMSDEKLQEDFETSFANLLKYCLKNNIPVVKLPGFSEIKKLYQSDYQKALSKENQQCQEVAKGLQIIEKELAESKNKAKEGQSSVTEEDEREFKSKLVDLIKSRVYHYNTFRIPTASKAHAIITFFDAISKKLPDSLKSLFEKNKEAKAEIRTEIAKLNQEYSKATSQGQNLQKQITQLEQEVKNKLMKEAPSSEKSKDIQIWLTQRGEELQKEVEQDTRELDLMKSRIKPLQEVATEHAKKASSSPDFLEIAPESTLDENQKLLKDPMVKSLKEVYYKQYGTEVDIIKANDSASYLKKLNLVNTIEKQAIEVAAHLIKYFDATFDNVYINRETREIVIVKPSASKVGSDLRKVEFDCFGRLGIDGKKQKAFVTVSPEEMPDVLILPVKAEMAYGSVAFAGGTPMLPGGTAGIEDLLGIEKGNMNILAIAAEREFVEETRGKYQLVRGTLKYVTEVSRIREDALFFEAKARSTTTVIDTQACTETKDTLLLNIIDMIRENKLYIYSNPFRREFTMKQAIIKEAQRQRPDLIAKVPEKEGDFQDGLEGKTQWEQYFTAYCTDHLVNYIKERIPGYKEQRQEISYEVIESDSSNRRERGPSDSSNWRLGRSDSSNRRLGRSDSSNWRERGPSDSSNWREQGSSSSSANS